MILIKESTHDPSYSLACEMYYMSRLSEPFFMLWSNEPAVIMGKYQNMYAEVNLPYLKEHGIRLVRRYSGGGTVYTDRGGWQYSLFLPGMKASEADFRREAEAITDTVNLLGANAYFSDRNDIYVQGKKVAGIAQFSNEFGLMHHICMLYSTDIDVMLEATNVSAEKIKSKGIKSVRDRVTNISEHINEKLTSEQFANFILANIYGGKYDVIDITPADHEAIMAIRAKYFANPDFVKGINQKFDVEYGRRFDGGRVNVGLHIQGGRIEKVNFSGDFFFAGEISQLYDALTGLVYEREAVASALDGFKDRFLRITPDEIVDMMFA